MSSRACPLCRVEQPFAEYRLLPSGSRAALCLTCETAQPTTRRCFYCAGTRRFRHDLRYAAGVLTCKTCRDRRRAEDLPRVREERRARDKGLTVEELRALEAAQRGQCGICERPFTEQRRSKIDHCHATQRVRGLLCQSCNTAIGKLGDNAAGVRRALTYLEATEDTSHE